MAHMQAEADFDPDRLANPVLGVATTHGRHGDGVHQHQKGQLLFTQGGCIRIAWAQRLCLLPPTRAAWIPPATPHSVVMRAAVGYRSLYFDMAQIGPLPDKVEVLAVSPLLRAVLERMAFADFETDWRQGAAANLLAVCLDEIQSAPREATLLQLPTDRRLADLSLDEMPPALHVLAAQVGACERTISRLFVRDTGLNYQQWRQKWRFLRAVERLAQKQRLSEVATDLGFASDSAFVAFFKAMSGQTPGQYLARQESAMAEGVV